MLLLGGALLLRRLPLGYVTAPGLLFVSGLGGVAFSVAAVIDNVLSGPQTQSAVIATHLIISAVSFALLAFFVRREPDSKGAVMPARHTREDFADGAQHFDLTLGTAGRRSLLHLRRALTSHVTLVIVGGKGGGRCTGGFDRAILTYATCLPCTHL